MARARLARMLCCALLVACGDAAPGRPSLVPIAPADASPVVAGAVDAAVAPLDGGPVLGAPGWNAPVGMVDAAAPALPSDGKVTYHKHVRALIETHCLDCHKTGGIGPFPFESWSNVQPVAAAIVGAVESGVMPPSPWDSACQKLADDPTLPEAARALFSAWKAAGFPEGKPADYLAPAPRAQLELGPPSVTMTSGFAYTPPARADEYRCFVLGELDSDTYLTGLQILPGQASEVHHVQIHRVDAEQRGTLLSRDQSDPKPGYACSGGTGLSSQNMFSYRPGSGPVSFLKGDAAYMKGGSTLLIQVHYNTVFLPAGQPPAPDETKIALWTLPPGELPERVVYRTTVFGPIDLPAGDTSVVSSVTTSMRELSSFGGFLGLGGTFVPGEIIGMTPHAHQLATRMWASLKRADGSSSCLDEVPEWDFAWQLDYLFANGVPYGPDDELVGNCEFDNGPDNQAVIDGVRQTPRRVTFGERSIDEMCQHYIWLRFERDAFLAARSD